MRAHLVSALAVSVAVFSHVAPAQAGATDAAATSAARLRVHVPRAAAAPATAQVRDGATHAEGELRALAAEARGLDLRATGSDTFGDGDRVVRFGQVHRGLPVLHAGASVRLGAAGDARLAVTALAKDLPTSVAPTLPAEEAAKVVRARVGALPFAVDAAAARLAIHTSPRSAARLAWVFLPIVPAGLPFAPRVIVDAHTGEVLEAVDAAVAAKARVYRTNPEKSPTLESLDLAMAPTVAGGFLANPFVSAHNCRGDGVVKPISVQGFNLSMRACELAQSATPTSAGNYDYTPIDDPTRAKESGSDVFSEVSIYHHVTRIYEFYRKLQGVADAQVVVEKPIHAVANLRIDSAAAQGNFAGMPGAELVPMSNAFYSPAGGGLGDVFGQLYGFDQGSMWFFQGPKKDYAYDGDVVYHEFTHAVVNATLQLGAWTVDDYGMIDAPGAMNEGLADYFSAALSGDPDVGEYASKDISATLTSIRTLANQDRCPTGVVGEVHYDSTLFSGGLWSARTSLADDDARARFDAALYKAMRTSPGQAELGYADVANLFLATLRTDFPAGASALEKTMGERGVLPACTRVYDYAGTPIAAPKGSGIPGFVSPGKQPLGPGVDVAPGILQARYELPQDATTLKVTFKGRGQSGGLGGLGGGTPWKPVVIVKWDDAVKWNPSTVKSNAEVKIDPTKSGQTDYAATIPVPAGKKLASVQIANAGDSDGTFDGLALAADGTPATGTPGGAPGDGSGDGPVTTRPVEGTGIVAPPDSAAAPKSEGGCGCSVPSAPPGLATGALAGLALALGARLRRRTRR